MAFSTMDAAGYRALSEDAFTKRIAEVKDLMNAETLPEGVTDEMLFEEARLIQEDMERRNKRNSFNGLSYEAVQERNAKATSVLAGEGNVIDSSAKVEQKRESGFKAVSEGRFEETIEYRRALAQHILRKAPMPQGMQMPPMVDVTHPERFPKADANPLHDTVGDSILCLAAEDAKAAIRMVREHADAWHINKDKIGFLGFSAGGGVAIAATMSANTMEHPNFLCTNFGPSLMPVTVPTDAPPLLIMSRADHPNVAAGLVALFMEWKKAGANAELHLYGDGRGPYELMPETGQTTTETWGSQLIKWLKAKGF